MRLLLLFLALLAVGVNGQINATSYNCREIHLSVCNAKAPFCRATTYYCHPQTCSQQPQLWCHSSTLTPFCHIDTNGTCVNGSTPAFPASVQSGRITFGKGLYGATLGYSINAIGVRLNTGRCGVDYFCHGNSTCNTASTGCVCASPCWTGPLCNLAVTSKTPVPVAPGGVVYDWYDTVNRNTNVSQYIRDMYGPTTRFLTERITGIFGYFPLSTPDTMRAAYQSSLPIPAPPRLPTVCYEDMPTPLACTQCTNETRCMRQTAPSSALGVVVPASDVCCPRGFAGNDCNTPVSLCA